MKSVRENTKKRERGSTPAVPPAPASRPSTTTDITDTGGRAPKANGARDGWAYAEGADEQQDLAPVVGANLRRLRMRRGLSLEKLSQRSGVSRAMLGQIELGQSAPTINVLWKIARALDVTFATLIQTREAGGTTVLRRVQAKVLSSQEGQFSSRALFPFDGPRRAEFYELRLAAGATEDADAHAPGTVENLVVAEGALELHVGKEVHHLETGDAILFEADVPHSYSNLTGAKDCVMFLVMTYADQS